MLLYVDKKKQRRRKIRIILLIVFFTLFTAINIFHFPATLNKARSSLLDYQPQTSPREKYPDTPSVTLLAPHGNRHPSVIIVPQNLNRQNMIIIANAFSLISKQTQRVSFTPEIKHTDMLLSLLQIFIPECGVASPAEQGTVLITSDFNAVRPQIKAQKLSPQTIGFSFVSKQKPSPAVLSFLDVFFPKRKQPKTALEKEQYALQDFTRDNADELRSVCFEETPAFAKEAVLLKNASVCLKSEKTLACSLANNVSLIQNIRNARRKLLSGETPQKLYLLTSGEEVSEREQTVLNNDEGLLFRFGIREAIIIPQDGSHSAAYFFPQLKLKAGINPDYSCNRMKFYKFKTVEIDLHDKI